MKNIIISFFSLAFVMLLFTSCDTTPDDFMTGDVKTGGLVTPLKSFPYKVGQTTTFDVDVTINKGPGVKSIEVYKTYTGKTQVLDRTIDVASANATEDVQLKVAYNYASLATGLSLPPDEGSLTIGDSWTLSYVSIMEDDRKVLNSSVTSIGVANFFAGPYELNMQYFHPTAGGSYPTEAYGGERISEIDMPAVSASECTVWFGVWEDDLITVKINPDNSIDISFDRSGTPGDPEDPTKINHYDPVTGKIYLYYSYPGAGGNRIFWAVYTPI